MVVMIVTGTPGTGKTEVAMAIASRLDYDYFDVKMFIARHKLQERYDRKRDTFIVDEQKLVKLLLKYIEGRNIVIDSHLAHYIPKRYVDLCVITKCSVKELRERLKKRGYSKAKIDENVQAEIFDICFNEAYEAGHKLLIIDTTGKKPSELVASLF